MARGHREQELTIVFQGRTTAFPLPPSIFIFPFSTFPTRQSTFSSLTLPLLETFLLRFEETEMETGTEKSREESYYRRFIRTNNLCSIKLRKISRVVIVHGTLNGFKARLIDTSRAQPISSLQATLRLRDIILRRRMSLLINIVAKIK